MKTGILIANLGTPSAPTPEAVREYLAEFLSDPRVVQIPAWLWQPILHGIVLRKRPARSAAAYQKIWTAEGSPLLTISQKITDKLQLFCGEKNIPVKIALGMRYGKPCILNALKELQTYNIKKLIILPLYPQYSRATTESIFDAVDSALKKLAFAPELKKITHYAENPAYINAVANSIRRFWETHKRGEKLLISFHGLPQNTIAQGDPYYHQCLKTADLIAAELQLSPEDWQVVFQSRFGLQKWLQPYCDQTLISLAEQGCKYVDVVCPGFAADCLETLEEIAIQNREKFLSAGGKQFQYISALNDSFEHIQLLASLI